MARLLLLSLPGLVAICAVHGIFMDRLASKKLCADDECVYTISLARAQEDFNAPDCRFINVKEGQQIYVYSKLVKENGAGEFWAGSVYGDGQEGEMGTVGYFPSSLVEEQHVYQEATEEVPTTDVWNNTPPCNEGFLETGRFGSTSTPTLSVERVVNFLHLPTPVCV